MPECPLLVPNTIYCSNHGFCDTSFGGCICSPNWSSLGDFGIAFGADCDQFIPAIRALGIINTVIQPFGVIFSVRIIYIRYKNGTKWHELLMLTPVSVLVVFVSGFMTGILKAINPVEFALGISFASTFFTCLFSGAFVCACALFGTVIVTFFKGYAKTMPQETQKIVEEIIEIMNIVTRPIYVLNFCGCVLPVFIHIFPQYAYAFGATFYVSLGLSLTIFRHIFLKALNIMIKEIKNFIVNSKVDEENNRPKSIQQLEMVLSKLVLVTSTTNRQAPMAILQNFVFGLWPFLQRKSAYLILVKGIMATIQCTAMLYLVSPSNTFAPVETVTSLRYSSASSVVASVRRGGASMRSSRIHMSADDSSKEASVQCESNSTRSTVIRESMDSKQDAKLIKAPQWNLKQQRDVGENEIVVGKGSGHHIDDVEEVTGLDPPRVPGLAAETGRGGGIDAKEEEGENMATVTQFANDVDLTSLVTTATINAAPASSAVPTAAAAAADADADAVHKIHDRVVDFMSSNRFDGDEVISGGDGGLSRYPPGDFMFTKSKRPPSTAPTTAGRYQFIGGGNGDSNAEVENI